MGQALSLLARYKPHPNPLLFGEKEQEVSNNVMLPFFGSASVNVIPILGEMLVPGTKYNITERSINGYTIVNTLQVHSTFCTLRVETVMVLFFGHICALQSVFLCLPEENPTF